MDMLAPKRAVVGADDVVVIDDSVLFVWTRHCGRVLPFDAPCLGDRGNVIVPIAGLKANGYKIPRKIPHALTFAP